LQDRRRQIWHRVADQRWTSLEALNTWLAEQCTTHWRAAKHAEWPELTIADVL
jgi:hypothetical protein